MKILFIMGLFVLNTGCGSPCQDLNADLVDFYESCDVEIPEELQDGGKGSCDSTDEQAACKAACYTDCAAIDGSDAAAVDDLDACLSSCDANE